MHSRTMRDRAPGWKNCAKSCLPSRAVRFRNNLCPLSFVGVPKPIYIQGILGVYELNQMELLRDVFVWGYERSVKRYLSTREELGEPDPFRLKYRKALTEVIRDVVLQAREDLALYPGLG